MKDELQQDECVEVDAQPGHPRPDQAMSSCRGQGELLIFAPLRAKIWI